MLHKKQIVRKKMEIKLQTDLASTKSIPDFTSLDK